MLSFSNIIKLQLSLYSLSLPIESLDHNFFLKFENSIEEEINCIHIVSKF